MTFSEYNQKNYSIKREYSDGNRCKKTSSIIAIPAELNQMKFTRYPNRHGQARSGKRFHINTLPKNLCFSSFTPHIGQFCLTLDLNPP